MHFHKTMKSTTDLPDSQSSSMSYSHNIPTICLIPTGFNSFLVVFGTLILVAGGLTNVYLKLVNLIELKTRRSELSRFSVKPPPSETRPG